MNITKSIKSLYQNLKHDAEEGKTASAKINFDFIRQSDADRTSYPYNLLIKACYRGSMAHLAHDVYDWILDDNRNPDHYTFNSLIHCCALLDDFDKANRYLAVMQEYGLSPDDYTANNWIDAAIKTNHLKEAIEKFLPLGLKVKIRKKTFCDTVYDAIDCHGYSQGAACVAISIYLEKTELIKKFQIITGAGMHSKKSGEMRDRVIKHIETNHPDMKVWCHPTNFGLLWVEQNDSVSRLSILEPLSSDSV